MDKTNLPVNPFPGIRSYEIHESGLFFGREKHIKDLSLRLKNHNFLSVVGSSGCGKSSLIKAGLIPTLLKSEEDRKNLFMLRPGEDPVENIAACIINKEKQTNELPKSNIIKLKKYFLEDEKNLYQYLKNKSTGKAIYIFVDQFEELFRFSGSSIKQKKLSAAKHFVNLLLETINQKENRINVILSMRTDFLDQCAEFTGLTGLINKANYLVPRMNHDELSKAITGPIDLYKGEIADNLVSRLLKDVGNHPDHLPILQHAMMRTWDYWKLNRIGDQPIDIEYYEAIGTMKKALSYHLEEIYSELWGEEDRRIAEKMFKALTDFSEEKQVIRHPTKLSEICDLTEAPRENVIKVIDIFREPGRSFLMPPYHVKLKNDSVIDITHESIMRIWVRLSSWIEEERQSSELYQRLAESAVLYQKGKSGLSINPELQMAINWRNKYKPNKSWAKRYNPHFEKTMTFLDKSKKVHEDTIRQKEEQQRKNLRRARRFSIILGTAAVVSIFFLAIALYLRFKAEASRKEALENEKIAIQASKKAKEQRKESIIQKKIAQQQQQIAAQQKKLADQQRQYAIEQQLIALEQSRIAKKEKQIADSAKAEAIQARDEANQQRQEAILQREIAEKEKTKAEKSENNARRLMLLSVARSLALQASRISETVEGELPSLLALQAYKFNRDNNGNKYEPDIFKALSKTAEYQNTFRQHKDGVRGIDINNTGQLLASCSDDGNIYLWEINNPDRNPAKINTGASGKNYFRCIEFGPHDQFLVAGSADGKLFIWEKPLLNTKPDIIKGHQSIVYNIAVNNNSKHMATASADGTIKLWDLSNLNSFNTIDSVKAKVTCADFNNDGSKLAYCCSNGDIKVIRMDGSGEITFSVKEKSPATSVCFGTEGKYLATGFLSGMIKIWNIDYKNENPIEIIGRHSSQVSSLVITSDMRLFSGSYDGTIKGGYFLKGEESPISINDNDLWVYDICLSPDGNYLASGSADKTARIFIINPEILVNNLLSNTSRNLTREEWNQYIGNDIKYEKTIDNLQ